VPGIGIQVGITGDVSGLKGSLDEAKTGLDGFGGALNALPLAAVAGGALAVGTAIVGMTKAAEEDEAAQAKLNAVYDAAGAATGAYNEAIDRAIDLGAEKAFGDDAIRAALEPLVIATGDAEEANKLLGPALDIARLAGVDAEVAASALAKAHQGNDAALRKLIPGLEKGTTATDTIAKATELASGQADLYAESAQGMAEKGQNAFEELGEEVGGAFLPVMKALLPLIDPIVDLLSELVTAVLPLLGPAVDIIVIAIKALVIVLKAVVDGIKQVLDWIGDMVDKFRDAANFIGSVDLNPFSLPGGGEAPAGRGRGRGARAGDGGGGGGNTINVNVQSADPTEVMRAIRRWSRNNGGSGPFTRGLDRSTA